MSILKERLMKIEPNFMEETIALAPMCMIAELIKEYEPTLETLIVETLKTIIKDIKEERRNHENN